MKNSEVSVIKRMHPEISRAFGERSKYTTEFRASDDASNLTLI